MNETGDPGDSLPLCHRELAVDVPLRVQLPPCALRLPHSRLRCSDDAPEKQRDCSVTNPPLLPRPCLVATGGVNPFTGGTGANRKAETDMSRFNTQGHRAKPAVATAVSPLGTTSTKAPDTRTFERGVGWTKNAKTDLFLRASASLNDGGNKFYETGYERDAKLRELARQVAVEDFTWFAQFVKWLRRTANIRTSAIMVAADGVKARLDAGLHGVVGANVPRPDGDRFVPTNRSVIDSVLYRADEPGEMLAYWMNQYGRRVPKPVKRGIADAATRLYTQRSLLKYDTASHPVRFADVIELSHPTPDPDKVWQGDLFEHAIDRRHGRTTAIPESLWTVHANFALREDSRIESWLNPEFLDKSGMTWEDALSAVGSKVDKAKLWEALIPSMGYMALLRNLRNFDEAGISNEVVNQVIAKLVDPDEVAKSRQLPFRFYSAFTNVPSLRWGQALETALDLCLPNIPEFTGRTLVLIDTSASMNRPMSGKSSMSCVQAAALFGAAVAMKNPGSVDLHHFANYAERIPVSKGGSVLRLTSDIQSLIGRVGHGTEMAGSIRSTYGGHDRVLLFSDMQAFGGYVRGVSESVPANIPVYGFNLEGYSASPMPTGSAARFDLGGMSDQTFKLIPLLEQGRGNVWPWEL